MQKKWMEEYLMNLCKWYSILNVAFLIMPVFKIKAEAPILWPPDAKSRLIGKDPDAGKDWGQEKGVTEDEIVGWHHQLNKHEFEQTLGDSEEQESLLCYSPWSPKESDTS